MSESPERRSQYSLRTIPSAVTKGGIAALAVRIIGIGIVFITEVIIARLLGVDSYGIYTFTINLITLLAIFAKFGLDQTNLRYIPPLLPENNHEELKGLLLAGRYIVFSVSGLLTLLIWLGVWLLRHSLSDELAWTLFFSGFLLPVYAAMELYASGLQAFKQILSSLAPVQILRPVILVNILLFAIFVTGLTGNAPMALSANLFATLIAGIISFVMLYRSTSVVNRGIKPRYYLGRWIKFGLQMLLISGFAILLNRIDILMVGWFLGTKYSGLYSAASKISLLVSLGLVSVNTIVAPMISELHSAGETSALRRLITFATRSSFIFTLFAVFIIAFFGNYILSIFGFEFTTAYSALILLSFGQLINSASGSVGYLTTMTGHQTVSVMVFGISACLNIILNFLLIPIYGIMGAAIATALTTALWNISLVVFAFKRLGINATVFSTGR